MSSMGIATQGPESVTIMALIIGPLGPINAVCLGLAFMPPARYLRWLEASAA